MREYERIKVMESGVTKNYDWWTGKQIAIEDTALDALVELGNKQPIRSRLTHNGQDMLDGFAGKFTNFEKANGVVYADFTLSAAAQKNGVYDFLEAMLDNEPDMLGCSVVIKQETEETKDSINVVGVSELWSIDFVGVPAATSSLYAQSDTVISTNVKKENEKMSLFTMFGFGAKKYATETVTSDTGAVLTIEKKGEVIAIGDVVKDEAGEVVMNGELILIEGDQKVKVKIENGVISEIEQVEEITITEPASPTPEEFAAVVAERDAYKAEIDELNNKLATYATSKAPVMAPAPQVGSTEGKLSADELREKRNEYRKLTGK